MKPSLFTPLRDRTDEAVCLGRGVRHVYRFNRYIGGFNMAVHPRHPDRLPKMGVFRCVHCHDEIICKIKHRP